MNVRNRVLDFFSPDRRFRDEIKEWQASGELPPCVERHYTSKRIRRKDVERMQALGYRIVKQEEAFKRGLADDLGGVGSGGGLPAGERVTYSRNAFE